MTGWTAVKRDVDINHDLENSPLQIRTDSPVGSHEEAVSKFYTAGGRYIGGVYLTFTSRASPPQYYLDWCKSSWTNFPTALPSETDKIWTVTLSKTSGIRLTINCNNKEVLKVVMSDTTCSYKAWSDMWSSDVEKIKFPSGRDTASDYYRPGKFNLLFYLC